MAIEDFAAMVAANQRATDILNIKKKVAVDELIALGITEESAYIIAELNVASPEVSGDTPV